MRLVWLTTAALRCLVIAAAPCWFAWEARPQGYIGLACAALALAASAYGSLCLLAAAGALLLTPLASTRRPATARGAQLARAWRARCLRTLGIAALLGSLGAPLAASAPALATAAPPSATATASQGPADEAPSPGWPATPAKESAPSPTPSGLPTDGQVALPSTPTPSPTTPSRSAAATSPAPPATATDAPTSAAPAPSVGPGTARSAPSDTRPPRAYTAPAVPRELPRLLGGERTEGEVVVRHGESLWSIAARHLGPRATHADIAKEWPRWYRLNADVVGADPDRLLVGTRLFVPE